MAVTSLQPPSGLAAPKLLPAKPDDLYNNEDPYYCAMFPENCAYGGGGGGGSTTIVQQGETSVTVNVTNAETIGQQVADTVAGAVKSGIDASATAAKDVATQAADEVKTGLANVVDKITGAVSDALSAIGGVLKSIGTWIWTNLTDIFGFIVDHVKTILSDIKDVLVTVIDKIAPLIDSIAKQVQNINDTLIQPVANFINGTLTTIGTLTTAIEKDLHDGLSGILKIPTDVANGLSSLDATLQRTIEQLGLANKEVITSTWNPTIRDTIGTPLDGIGRALGGISGVGPVHSTFDKLTNLPEECSTGPITEWLANIQGEISASDAWWAKGLKVILDGLLALDFVLASLEQKKECYSEQARKAMPITKLDTGTALGAYVRKFIDDKGLHDELSVKGFDSARIDVMKSMQVFLADIGTALDWWYRGIIDDADLKDNFEQHGILTTEADALKRGSLNLFPPDLATELYVRGLIDSQALDRAWARARMSDEERGARFDVLLHNADPVEEMRIRRQISMVSNGYNIGTYHQQAPDDFLAVAKRHHMTPELANTTWQLQWYVPSIDEAISLFFRGIRTRTELFAIMDHWGVPPEIKDELIESRRPLIPFRSIPAMLKSGEISEGQATQYLAAHGFAQATINVLLKKAEGQTASTTATQAVTLKAATLGSAKELYLDGALTQDQYAEILKEHGFAPDAVDLEVKATDLHQSVQVRRTTAQGIIDEALAGLITTDDAQTQLAAHGYTIAEQGKYLKALRTAQRAASKIPSQAELAKMWKLGVIEDADYLAGVQALGYSSVWADRFFALIQTPDTAPTQPPTP